MKLILANTDLKISKLIGRLENESGFIGFDTEVSAPLLRGRDFIDISRAALLGISVAFEDEECYYMPFRHRGNNASFMQLHQVSTLLQRHSSRRRVWAHNAKFDHQVMIREGYPMVGMLDSMVAAWLRSGRNRGLGLKELAASLLGRQSPEFDHSIAYKTGQEVLEYACHDALNTLQLGLKFLPEDREWFYEECDFAFLLAHMKLRGMAIDRDSLRRIREEGRELICQMEDEWEAKCPFVSIGSSAQLQQLFEERVWVPCGKTKTGKYGTGKEVMEFQLEHAGDVGRDLARLRLDYQEINKLVSTYTDALIEESLQWADKRLHPDLHQFGTVTGRLSSSHPNIQNQPAHGDWAMRVKACFVPTPGMEFTSADYSQVELRYFAHYCGGNLLQAFIDEKDLHEVTAEMLGVDRQVGKTVNFGFLLYGGGTRKLSGLLGVSEAHAEELLQRLQAGYPEIEAWRLRVVESVSRRAPVPWCKTLAGRVRHIPELDPRAWEKRNPAEFDAAVTALRSKYGRLEGYRLYRAIESRGKRRLINYLVQGGSRDLLIVAMNKLHKTIQDGGEVFRDYSIVTTVHDEVLIEHPKGHGEVARDMMKFAMESAGERLGLRVPIVAEPKTASNWAECK